MQGMSGAPLLTDLIARARDGDAGAMRRLFDIAYDDLRRMARSRLGKPARGALLDTTSLVHESFIRFANSGELHINDRAHFFRYAGQVMRSVIVDIVRAAQAERRGGDVDHLTLNTALGARMTDGSIEILKVHDALEDLAALDARLSQVVELRYFAGLTEEQTAEALGVTDRTVRRDWNKARLLLAKALE